jgi:hypothetical protein
MNGTPTLYVDQYGNIFGAKTIKDIRSNVPMAEPDDASDLFFESVDAEDLESGSRITGDSRDGNFLTDLFSAAFLHSIARAALSTVVLAGRCCAARSLSVGSRFRGTLAESP